MKRVRCSKCYHEINYDENKVDKHVEFLETSLETVYIPRLGTYEQGFRKHAVHCETNRKILDENRRELNVSQLPSPILYRLRQRLSFSR